MSHLAPAALALALFSVGTVAFASHPAHTRPLSHAAATRVQPTHAAAHHGHQPHAAAAAHTRTAHVHPAPAKHHEVLARASRHASRQIPQPRHLRVNLHDHTHGHLRERAATRLQPAAPRALPVARFLRPNPIRPQLPDLAASVAQPITLPQLYNERGRLLVPAALVGSHEILIHQNTMADADGLGRIQNDADLDSMRARGMLADLPASHMLAVDERLPLNRRCARPWTVQFLQDLARDHYNHFHTPLQLTSAVRTVEFQHQLMHRNGNAAPADGDTASPHLTGQAIDLGKRGMSLPEIAWMRGYLLPLIQSGKIDVEEEFKQSCFHISVYRHYAPSLPGVYNVASRSTLGSATTTAAATATVQMLR